MSESQRSSNASAPATPTQVEMELGSAEVYVAIERADPVMGKKIHDALTEAAAQGESERELRANLRPLLDTALKHYLSIGSDQAILDYVRTLPVMLEQISAKNVDACFDYLFPTAASSPIPLESLISPDVMHQIFVTQVALIESGSQNPQSIPIRAQIARQLDEVRSQLVIKFGNDDVVAVGKHLPINHGKACAIMTQFDRELLKLPADDTAAIVRFAAASGSAL